LPVIPTSRVEVDKALLAALKTYALRLIKPSVPLDLQTVYVTSVANSLGVVYDLRFKDEMNEGYYALVESI